MAKILRRQVQRDQEDSKMPCSSFKQEEKKRTTGEERGRHPHKRHNAHARIGKDNGKPTSLEGLIGVERSGTGWVFEKSC